MSRKALNEIRKELSTINEGVKMAFSKVGDEFSEHLDTINANTSEISTLTQTILILEQKIDKLNERVDELAYSKKEIPVELNISYDLTVKEQEVFVTLYTSERFLPVKDIARLVGRTTETTNFILKRLMDKKVPILKETSNSQNSYALDKQFKQLQAKENIIPLHETVLKEMLC